MKNSTKMAVLLVITGINSVQCREIPSKFYMQPTQIYDLVPERIIPAYPLSGDGSRECQQLGAEKIDVDVTTEKITCQQPARTKSVVAKSPFTGHKVNRRTVVPQSKNFFVLTDDTFEDLNNKKYDEICPEACASLDALPDNSKQLISSQGYPGRAVCSCMKKQ